MESSSSCRPNEVFISFRGEDTRKNFVSHLLSALKDRGIRTYFDEDNLQKGQTIGHELVKAIEESSIAIVVLSCNYVSSTWCLDELVKIMECKNKIESGLIVFPIFYHVNASDVRWQENSFFEAFSIHEVNFKDDGEKLKSWREALTQVANLAGEEIRGQNEASCIKSPV
ncbi:hypothetical protein LIER_15968 [Lithospermum erythrorhizon]|uniref:ADP-ribosyl cyclase/cyclic ADP-ribose hydrolase n=1 Tax=Lithospermum erythrorhizon TaxID=34254 RepID=A0AAV3Q7D8_LITER